MYPNIRGEMPDVVHACNEFGLLMTLARYCVAECVSNTEALKCTILLLGNSSGIVLVLVESNGKGRACS